MLHGRVENAKAGFLRKGEGVGGWVPGHLIGSRWAGVCSALCEESLWFPGRREEPGKDHRFEGKDEEKQMCCRPIRDQSSS